MAKDKYDNPALSVDALSAFEDLPESIAEAARRVNSRSAQQQKMDQIVKDAHAKWLNCLRVEGKDGSPKRATTWAELATVKAVGGYWIPTDATLGMRHLITTSCNMLKLRPVFGNPTSASKDDPNPDHAGKVFFSFAVLDRNERAPGTPGPAQSRSRGKRDAS